VRWQDRKGKNIQLYNKSLTIVAECHGVVGRPLSISLRMSQYPPAPLLEGMPLPPWPDLPTDLLEWAVTTTATTSRSFDGSRVRNSRPRLAINYSYLSVTVNKLVRGIVFSMKFVSTVQDAISTTHLVSKNRNNSISDLLLLLWMLEPKIFQTTGLNYIQIDMKDAR
jgi:hypothetical protein